MGFVNWQEEIGCAHELLSYKSERRRDLEMPQQNIGQKAV